MKRVLVTGGVGGIGRAICLRFAEAGYAVSLTYRPRADDDRSERLLGELSALCPAPHTAHELDLLNTEAVSNLWTEPVLRDGVDVLVNCAGYTKFVSHGDLDALDDALIDRILAVNVRAPFAMVRGGRASLEKCGGCIINITSVAGLIAMGSNIAYCASKAALENMTKSLARVFAPKVRVLAVAPGLVDTSFIGGLDQDWFDEQVRSIPLGRPAQAEEVAELVFLAAEKMTFTTGSVLPMDGGRPLGL